MSHEMVIIQLFVQKDVTSIARYCQLPAAPVPSAVNIRIKI